MARGGKREGAGRRRGPTPQTRAIRRRIKQHQTLTADRTIEEIRRVALSDIGQIFDEAGRLKPLKDIPAAIRACISSVKTTKKNLTAGDGVQEDVVEVKLWDKIRALEMAAKHHGLLTEKIEHSGTLTLEDLVAASFGSK